MEERESASEFRKASDGRVQICIGKKKERSPVQKKKENNLSPSR